VFEVKKAVAPAPEPVPEAKKGAAPAPAPETEAEAKQASEPAANPAAEPAPESKQPESVSPASVEALSSRDLANERSAGEETRPTAVRKILESLPFFQVEPAPYDPRVPPLPNQAEIPIDEEQARPSGLVDLLSMMDAEEEALKEERADNELVNLSGGLFT